MFRGAEYFVNYTKKSPKSDQAHIPLERSCDRQELASK